MTTFPLPFHLQPPTILTTTESSVMHLPTLQTGTISVLLIYICMYVYEL